MTVEFTDADIARLHAEAKAATPGEICQDCGKRDSTGLYLPEKYAPHYSPSSFSPSELIARCDVCADKWRRMFARRKAKAQADADAKTPPYRWM
jgi:hypothetical protein